MFTEDLIYQPFYRTQQVALKPTTTAPKRGTIIYAKADGTFTDAAKEGGDSGTANSVYGILLDDLPADFSGGVTLLVEGEVFKSKIHAVNGAAAVAATAMVTFRNLGIILK